MEIQTREQHVNTMFPQRIMYLYYHQRITMPYHDSRMMFYLITKALDSVEIKKKIITKESELSSKITELSATVVNQLHFIFH